MSTLKPPHLLEYNFTATICATNDDIIGSRRDERKEEHKKVVANPQVMTTTLLGHAVLDCQGYTPGATMS